MLESKLPLLSALSTYNLRPMSPSSKPESSSAQAYLLFMVSLILVATMGTLVQILSVPVGLAITELLLVLLPAVLFVRWKGLPLAKALRWRPVGPAVAGLSVAVGVAGWGVAAGIHELSRPFLGNPPEIPGLTPETLPQLLLLLFSAALLPGICEETLFRGALQGLLWRRGSGQAVFITAVLFAVYHVNPWNFVPAIFLGVVFGVLVERTGSSVTGILAHCANNATAFTVAYLYRDQTEAAAWVLIAWIAASFSVVFPAFWMSTRGTQPSKPMLAALPAGLSRPYVWVAGLFGGALLLLIVAVAGALFALVDMHTMTSDALAPEVRRGEQLVLLKSGGLLELDLQVGDIVSCQPAGETVLFRIARMEGDRVWLSDGVSVRELGRKDITGKVVHTFTVSEN